MDPQEHPQWIADKNLRHVRRAHPVQRDPTEDDLLPFSGDVWVREVGNGRDTCNRWQQSDQAQCPPWITLTLTSTPERFGTWLEDHTRDYGNKVFICEYRSITFSIFGQGKPSFVRCDWYKGDTGVVYWTLFKRWLERHEGRESVGAAPIADPVLIKVNCLSLSSEKTQVRIETFDSWVWEYFWTSYIEMLKAIRQTWPESRAAIDEYLKGVGGKTASQEQEAAAEVKREPLGFRKPKPALNSFKLKKVKEYAEWRRKGLTQEDAAKRVKDEDGEPYPRSTLETWLGQARKEHPGEFDDF